MRQGMWRCVALAAMALTLGVASAHAAGVPNPSVEGPIQGGIRGYPWNQSLYDLRGFGYDYTENEYFFGGTATDLSNGTTAPYKSRMLVRLPRFREDFSGTVVVEWLNVTGQSDLETTWPVEAQWLMRHGIGYVGVSAQLAGVCCGPTTLKGWDPERYGTLVHPGDNYSYDIFSQAIQALRDPAHNGTTILSPKKVDPMRGLTVKHIVANGASQSASRLTSFVNGGYNRGGIDLYVITRGGGPYNDFSTPIFQLNEENNQAPQPDNKHYVAWEEAGTAHAPAAWWNYIWAEQQRDLNAPGTPDALNVACSVNRGSVDYSARALSYWVEQYFKDGTLPPSFPRVKTDASGNVVRDANGLAEGGVRQPFIQAPVAYNSAEGCPLWGNYRAWSSAKVKSLYPTHDAYVVAVKKVAASDVAAGSLLPEDRDDVIAKAQAFDGPWAHGTCYDTANQDGNEKGPVSSQVATESYDPNLPLSGESTLRDLNCNVLVPLGL
ncbi:MAG TPA: alpha/beta hydrolase domain-containing protein [Gemmataceae bacterium]|nr:alpha/beta hydrolase domain-containing protein [Gemmataceae bacterium]